MDPGLLAALNAAREVVDIQGGDDAPVGLGVIVVAGGVAHNHRLANLVRARAARLAKRAALAEVVRPVDFSIAALVIPGCAELAGISMRKSGHQVPMEAMVRLAVSSKVRGSGSSIDRVRRLQTAAFGLVGSSALRLQKEGLSCWLDRSRDGVATHFLRGFQVSWDEASQKLRALVDRMPGCKDNDIMKSQSSVQIMAVLASVCQLETQVDGESVLRRFDYQPWVGRPLILQKTSHAFILEGLLRTCPIDLSDREAMKAWSAHASCTVGIFCFDSASSNLVTMRFLSAFAERSGCRFLLHGERCSTHQLHMIKSASISLTKLAGMLYCISKVAQISRTIDGIRTNFIQLIRGKMVVRYEQPPDTGPLAAAALEILCMDGDDVDTYTTDPKGKRSPKKYLQDMVGAFVRMHPSARFGLHAVGGLTGMWVPTPSATFV